METKASTTPTRVLDPTETVKPRVRVRKRRWPWIVGVLLLLALAGGRAMMRPKPDDTKLATAARQDIRQTVTATGAVTLQTAAEVKIGAEVSGKVKRLYVDVGDPVRAGQLIAELTNPENDAILQQAKASVDGAAARVRQAEAALRQQSPETEAAVARAQAEVRAAEARARQARITANAQPRSSRAAIDQAQASLSIAQDGLTQAQSAADLQVQAAQSNLDAAVAQADLSTANARRARGLLAKGYVSQQEADQAETAQRVSEADVVARRKALALAQANTQHDLQAARHSVEAARAASASAQAASAQVGVASEQAQAAAQDLENAREALRGAQAAREQVPMRIAQVSEAQSAYAQSRAEYDRQRNNYAKMRIYSPINGIVTAVQTKEGETVTAGFQTPTLLTVANLNRIQVDVDVDETDIGRLAVGQKADVTVDAFPTAPLPGRVVKIASDASVENNVVSYKCTVAIDHANAALKPRMTATVNIDTGLVKNALVLPIEAVKTARDKDVVYLPPAPSANTKALFVEKVVKTGASDDRVIQILDGLHVGDKVVLTSSRLDAQRQRQGGAS